MKVVFMGTPQFAVKTLENIINSKHEVVGVFTQPDAPKGRSKKLIASPVKEVAIKYNIPVFQPKSIRKSIEDINSLKNLKPDVLVVVAFGQILPKEVLDIPKLCAINVHASLLPKYRGAAPINWSIINGEKYTGVTTMLMDVGLDTGDMLISKKIEIKDDDDAQTITDRLSELGAVLLMETLQNLENNQLHPIKQDDSLCNYAPMLDKKLAIINFDDTAQNIKNLIHGINVWPVATCLYKDKRLKIYKAKVEHEEFNNARIGDIVKVSTDSFSIKCKKDILTILEVQLEGKKRLHVKDFLNGVNIKVGDRVEQIVS